MTEKKTFRTALNGFNREDVVHYIEYLNAKHQSEVNQHLSETDFLRKQLAKANQTPAQDPALAQELDRARGHIAELEARLQEALADKEAALAAAAKAEADREETTARQTTAQSRIAEELEAYRRAERMEREARERAQKVYHQVNGVLADATVQVDAAASQIGTLSDQVTAQLAQLQEAVTGSKQALQEAAQTMYALRPAEE